MTSIPPFLMPQTKKAKDRELYFLPVSRNYSKSFPHFGLLTKNIVILYRIVHDVSIPALVQDFLFGTYRFHSPVSSIIIGHLLRFYRLGFLLLSDTTLRSKGFLIISFWIYLSACQENNFYKILIFMNLKSFIMLCILYLIVKYAIIY